MSDAIVQVADSASPTKNMRTIQRVVGGNTVQEEVVQVARPSDGTTVDPTQWTDLAVTGSLTNTSGTVILDVRGRAGWAVTISGAWSANIQIFVSADNQVSYVSLGNIFSFATAAWLPGILTANGVYTGYGMPGITHVKVKALTFASGTAVVAIEAGLGSSLASNNSISKGDGTGAAPLGATQIGGTDGTNLRVPSTLNSAPVGTEYGLVTRPLIAGWLGSAAPTVGQKTMASSVPTVIASDQTALPIGNPPNLDVALSTRLAAGGTVDVSDRDARLLGRAKLFDARGDAISNRKTFRAISVEVTLGTAVGQKSIAYLWHPSASALVYKIWKVWLWYKTKDTAGTQNFNLNFITAENGTPGGTVETRVPHDRADTADATANAAYRSGAALPTRVAGLLESMPQLTGALTVSALYLERVVLFDANDSLTKKPIILRASQAEGLEVYQDVLTTLTTAPIVRVGMEWTEE